MPRRVKPRRRYESPRRREAAAATRRAVLEAARLRFEEDGYAATSIAAIAADAGVSAATVYVAFETKGGLLRAVWHLLLRGDRDDVPVAQQGWYREVIDAPDAETQVRLNARNSRRVKQRVWPLIDVIREAAPGDEEAGGLWARIESEFHANQREIVVSIDAKGGLAAHLDVDTAADVMWTLNHPSVYGILRSRGWDDDRYEEWLTGAFRSQILGLPPRPDAGSAADGG